MLITLWLLLFGSWCYGIMWMSGGHHGPDVMGFYLNLSSGHLISTSSHMCGSWYLPIFLFRDGSFTHTNIASLVVLAMVWSSLSTILKLSRDNSWPVMLWWSWIGWSLHVFYEPLCKWYAWFPSVFFHHSPPCHTWTCRSPHSFAGWYLCLWGVPGGPWWCCLLWNTFPPHVFCRCFCRSHPCLGCMGKLCRAYYYCLSCLCFWLSFG